MPDFSKQLSRYVPELAAPIISEWINQSGCRFTIAKKRKTKLGDYQAPFRGKPHRISVNHDLNKYAFLITTIHEFAHLKTWNAHKDRVKPHGAEWKENFKHLMQPFFQSDIFPRDIREALQTYMNDPAAASCTDIHLFRTLKSYDASVSSRVTVESLPSGSKFALEDGRQFLLQQKIRTRYKCEEVNTGKLYLFYAVAEVIPIR